MPDSSEERRARLRSVAVAVMIATASFATLATSRAAAQIEDGLEGPAFLLDQAHPSYTARYSLQASPTAFQGSAGRLAPPRPP